VRRDHPLRAIQPIGTRAGLAGVFGAFRLELALFATAAAVASLLSRASRAWVSRSASGFSREWRGPAFNLLSVDRRKPVGLRLC
jgi:hypothetical protein